MRMNMSKAQGIIDSMPHPFDDQAVIEWYSVNMDNIPQIIQLYLNYREAQKKAKIRFMARKQEKEKSNWP